MGVSHTRQNTISYDAVGVTAPGSVVFDNLQGHGSLIVVLQGTFTLGQAVFEGTVDNTNWFSIGAALATGGGTFGPNTGGVILADSSSAYMLPIAAGIASVRLRVTTFTSGVMNVSAVAAGGSLSVQTAASSVSGGDGAVVDGIDATIRATVFDYANSNPLAVTLRDTNGDTVGSGGTQYVETGYVAAASPATGTVALCRNLAGGLVPIPLGETGLLSCEIQAATVTVASDTGTHFSPTNFDLDTGAGFVLVSALAIALPASGGPVVGGTSTNPIRTDPTGATVQPVSATALPLPTGAATGGKQDTAQTSLSQIVSATSDALVALGDINTALISTTATAARQDTGNASLASIDGKLTNPLPVSLPAGFATSAIQTTQQTALDAIKAAVETIDNFISGARGLVTEDNSAAILSGMATAVKQDTGNASLAIIATDVAPLVTAQGASGASVAGPMVQGLVNDTPSSYSVGVIQPLSLTAEGRLRVTTVPSTVDQIWQDTFTVDPWDESPWGALPSVAASTLTSVGDVHV